MKKLLFILLGLIILIGGGIGYFLLTFDLNTYRQMIADRLSETLGRPVIIAQMETKLSLIPTIKIRGIRVENQEGFSSFDPFMVIDTAEATLAVAPLLSKRLEIQNLVLNKVNVWLTRLESGRINFDFSERGRRYSQGRSESVTTDKAWQIRLDSIGVHTIDVTYRNGQSEQKISLSDLSLKQLKVFTVTVKIADKVFKLTGTLDDLMELLNQKQDYLFNLEIVGAEMTTKLSGSIGNTKTWEDILLNIDVTGAGLKQTAQYFGLAGNKFPAQPFTFSAVLQGDLKEVSVTKADLALAGGKLKANLTGKIESLRKQPAFEGKGQITLSDWALGQLWGLQPFVVNFNVAGSPKKIELTRFDYRAGRSDVQVIGQVNLDADIPVVTATINSEYLEIQDVFQTEAAEYAAVNPAAIKANKVKVIPDAELDFAFLQSLNGQINMMMPHIKLSEAIQGYLGLRGDVAIKDGRLSADQFRLDILNGVAMTDLSIQSGTDQRFTLGIKGEGFDLNAIKSLKNVIQGASVDLSADLEATGNRLSEVLSTLNGNMVLEVPQGTIMNPWFNDLVENLDVYKKRTVSYSVTDRLNKILCAAAKLTIRDGVVSSPETIALETSNISFLIGGQVSLPTEKVEISMRPFIHQNEQTKLDALVALASQLIRLNGTFQRIEPSFVLDETALKGLALSVLSHPSPYQLCEGVLGYKTKGQMWEETRKSQMLPITETVREPERPLTPQEKFQQQLMDSVNKVLK